MAWSISDRFPSWGETGEFPGTGFFYEGGDQVNEKHLDALWNGLNGLEGEIQSALNDIDNDADGIVDEADTVTAGGNLKGDLLAVGGEVVWDESAGYIPQPRLQNDDLTVTAGDGLKDGGLVALGGSTTVNVEPADFAGHGLDDDGADNLRIDGADLGAGIAGGDGVNLTLDESVIKDGGAKEIDAQEFAGGDGTAGQVLQTDGANAFWETAPTAAISDDGTQILLSPDDINFASNITASDDGDNTVSVSPDTNSINPYQEMSGQTITWSSSGVGGTGAISVGQRVSGGTLYGKAGGASFKAAWSDGTLDGYSVGESASTSLNVPSGNPVLLSITGGIEGSALWEIELTI